MDAYLFNIIAWAAVLAFVVGVLSGIWPTLLIGLLIGLGMLWLSRPIR